MKFIPVFLLSFFVNSLISQAQKAFTMDDIPLEWSQFTRTHQTIVRQHGAALIGLNSQYSWESQTKGAQTIIDFTTVLSVKKETSQVSSVFLRNASQAEKDNLLNHEKGHLIIGLIKNLWIEDTLKRHPFTTQFKKELRAVYSAVEEKANILNTQYDEETMHSLNTDQQKEWEKRLLAQFSQLMHKRKELPFTVNLKLNVFH